MAIGHTWRLQLHTLSEEERGQLIYNSGFSVAGRGRSARPSYFLFEDRSYALSSDCERAQQRSERSSGMPRDSDTVDKKFPKMVWNTRTDQREAVCSSFQQHHHE